MSLPAMMRKERGGIEDEIARLKHVSKALMQQLNIGAAAPDLVLQGGNDAARPRLEKIGAAGDRVGCWLLENQVEPRARAHTHTHTLTFSVFAG